MRKRSRLTRWRRRVGGRSSMEKGYSGPSRWSGLMVNDSQNSWMTTGYHLLEARESAFRSFAQQIESACLDLGQATLEFIKPTFSSTWMNVSAGRISSNAGPSAILNHTTVDKVHQWSLLSVLWSSCTSVPLPFSAKFVFDNATEGQGHLSALKNQSCWLPKQVITRS